MVTKKDSHQTPIGIKAITGFHRDGKKPQGQALCFYKKTGNVAAGRSDGCGVNCAEDTVKEALGGDKADVAFTTATRPRTGKEVPICKDCQKVHGEEAFPTDAKRQ